MFSERRTFLVGLGRFALGAAGLAIVKPRVLYSFPTDIRIATNEELFQLGNGNWVAVRHVVEGASVLYTIDYHLHGDHPIYPFVKNWTGKRVVKSGPDGFEIVVENSGEGKLCRPL